MDIVYHYAESTIQPRPVEMNGGSVYLRKEIVEESREDINRNAIVYWTYQEAILSMDEFREYSASILLEKQKTGDDDRLMIMSAIADLYELVAALR